MTEREREILIALRAGALLRPASHFHRSWELVGLPAASKIGAIVYRTTVENMRRKELIRRDTRSTFWRLIPTTAALEMLEK